MRIFFLLTVALMPSLLFSQTNSAQWPRAFPITGYIVDLNDSIKLVQVQPGEGVEIADKQLGLLRELYRTKSSDTATIGAGRCNLIKGAYYYFSINCKKSAVVPREGDLLYVLIKKTPVYDGRLTKVAAHFIILQDVYEKPWYDHAGIFANWSAAQEEAVLDSMLKDIYFTADYFLKENPSMNIKIVGGRYDGKMVLNTMITSTRKDLNDFLDYIQARPRLYAGNRWKISEVFATWLSGGAPTVIKDK